MRRFAVSVRIALGALLSHWGRNRLQLAAAVGGLMLATALWSGVQAINAHARASYAKSAAVLGAGTLVTLARPDGAAFDQAVFTALRRSGHDVSPRIEGRLNIGSERLAVIGIEPVSLAPAALPDALREGVGDGVPDFLRPPWQTLAAAETAAALGALDHDLPPLVVDDSLPVGTVIVDIGVAQGLLDQSGEITSLTLAPGAAVRSAVLERYGLDRVDAENRGTVGGLTDSFHLNLTAFAFLAFVVGLVIVHAAISLALEQRRGTIRTIRALGVSGGELGTALIVEAVALALVAGVAGAALGYGIALALLPDVARSLGALYDVAVAEALSVGGLWFLGALGMALAGALLAAASGLWTILRMPVLVAARPEAWLGAERRRGRVLGALAVGLAVLALGLHFLASGLVAGFATMAALLLAAAAGLPVLLATIVGVAAARARTPLGEWVWGDLRQMVPSLSLAMVAILLALSANVGVGTMVGGFRITFLGWLDQRLAAEVYVRGVDEAQSIRIDTWAAEHPAVRAVLPTERARLNVQGWPVEVLGVTDHATYRSDWPMIALADDGWSRVFAGDAVMISEQLAHRLDLGVGDTVPVLERPVAGTYPDYGNPIGQVVMGRRVLVESGLSTTRLGTGIRIAPEDRAAFLSAFRAAFDAGPAQSIDQTALKDRAREIFEQTFAVTQALNVLTLLVAGAALLASMLTLQDRRLPMLAPVWAVGVPRRRLAFLELVKTAVLTGLTAVLAVPVGVALAWLLVSVINVEAFGWRLPLTLFPGEWVRLVALALIVALLAAAIPVRRLARLSPAEILKVFRNAA